MIDAVSDILDTLLQQDTRDANANLSLTIAQSVLGNTLLGGNQLAVAQQLTGSNERARVLILSELVSAIGLQRFRFSERQSRGENDYGLKTLYFSCFVQKFIFMEIAQSIIVYPLPISQGTLLFAGV